MISKTLSSICGLLIVSAAFGTSSKLDSLLKELDRTIHAEKQLMSTKEKRINRLKQLLHSSTSVEAKFNIYGQIFDEYEVYICDSAYHYAQLISELADRHGNQHWANESKLQTSSILTISGMYPEAVDILRSVGKDQLSGDQLTDYYTHFYHAYNEWGEYAEYGYRQHYKSLGRAYQDSLLAMLQPEHRSHAFEHAWRAIESGDYERANSLLFQRLPTTEPNTRDYSILTSMIGILFWYLDDIDRHKEYLAQSAISDINASIMENTSLRSLANVLFGEGDLSRANAYIKKSLNDANFYNARLRSIQISKLYPIIENAYQLERQQRQRELQTLLAVISVLSVLLALTVVYIIIQFRKLAEARKQTLLANERLKDNNRSLAEANHIKEEYLGRFLNLCSTYIEKMETHHRRLYKTAKEGNLAALTEKLKSNTFIEEELAEFYQNFDHAFLKIFPRFIEQFNALLHREDQVTPKQGEILNAELRTFALIRLGITDSQRIAEFLRYSITTIYNYRSKFRNKATVPREQFEAAVMKISSFNA